MAHKARGNTDASLPERKRIYQYWVEVRDLRNGSTCTLPLRMTRKIYFPKRKEVPRPAEDCLQLQDGADTLEARDLDELAAALRVRYPDATYERRLYRERNLEAERKYAEALQGLIRLVARAAYNKLARQ